MGGTLPSLIEAWRWATCSAMILITLQCSALIITTLSGYLFQRTGAIVTG